MTATTSSTSPTSSTTPPLFDSARELRVMVDGSERAVCGLSVGTTCQDVIYALAHATGQTGRFVLIEQWHSSERCLAPHDRPLELLDRWKEHSGSVRFVLKHLEPAHEEERHAYQPRPHLQHAGEAQSFGSLPRPRQSIGGNRPSSVLAQPIYGRPTAQTATNPSRSRASSNRPPLPSYEEALARRQLLLRAQSQQPNNNGQVIKPDREALLKKVLEQKQHINQQEIEMRQQQADELRMTSELTGIQHQIEWYERQKVTLRQQIDALDQQSIADDFNNTSIGDADDDDNHTHIPHGRVDPDDVDSKLRVLDTQLDATTEEISNLQSQIAQLTAECPDDNNNHVDEGEVRTDDLDKQLRSVDEQMETRLEILKEMRVQANKMGIKTKPGVWV